MIAVEIRMSPSVFETSGLGLSVQLTKSALRSEKSHVLVVHSSSWKSVSGKSSPLVVGGGTLAAPCRASDRERSQRQGCGAAEAVRDVVAIAERRRAF